MGHRIIAIITGANAGVGLGISERFLLQSSYPNPSDAFPQPLVTPYAAEPSSSYTPIHHEEGSETSLTLILACRNRDRALLARDYILKKLDADIKRRRNKQLKAYGTRFRETLKVEFVKLDLASAAGTLAFCEEIKAGYPYISHIFCNAGAGAFTGVNFAAAIPQLITGWKNAVTRPTYKLQSSGSMSNDGLGWVWQCNVFGHYLLVRNIKHLLSASPLALSPARVIWTSSIEATAASFDPSDWQLIKAPLSYEASKYETELIAWRLNSYRPSSSHTITGVEGDSSAEVGTAINSNIRHLITHPGVVATSMFYPLLGAVLDLCMTLAFYIARALGSPHHPIRPVSGALACTFAALSSLSGFPSSDRPLRFGTRSDWFGRPYVAVEEIEEWTGDEPMEAVADDLIQKCDHLCEVWEKRVLDEGAKQA